jgi:glyoxylase-like metal-dependent hydrolase (beta-lactamase superfamily II)
MSYPERGHVEPGGPSAVRTIALPEGTEVELRKLSVGPMDNNAYLLCCDGEALLVDAAADAPRLLREVEDAGVAVRTIVTTHGHRDHWGALDEVAAATGAEVVFAAADAPLIGRPADRHVEDGEVLRFGAAEVRCTATPGHTPGSTCLLLAGTHLLTGDTLFPGGPGGTFGDAAAFATILRSLEERLLVLPDETWVYPGHGDDTTIGEERPHLEAWRARGW